MIQTKLFHSPYGTKHLELSLPASTIQLAVKEPLQEITPDLFAAKLRDFFRQYPQDLSRPVLVVADKTRLCGYPEYLPLLIDQLTRHGMTAEKLKIIIAYGTHPRQSETECIQAYGEVYNRFSFIHHDCLEKDVFISLGQTASGTPVRLRRDLHEASIIITMGAITHHYFAGYGGGRKLIFPGCGEREAIYANHSLYLDRPAETLACGCQPGNISGNPLAEDLFAVEEELEAHLAIHGLLDSHGDLCNLVVGRGRESFLAACTLHGENCEVRSRRYEAVVASCGGFPKDINFIQSHKAIHNAAMFVEDGGLLLVYCQCRDGIGSRTFLPWFEKGSFAAAFSELSARYEGNGGTALAMMTKLNRIRIGLITELDEETCSLIGVEKWSHDRVGRYFAGLDTPQQIAFISNASLLVKKY